MKLTVTDCQRIKTVEQQNVDTGHMNKQSDLVIMWVFDACILWCNITIHISTENHRLSATQSCMFYTYLYGPTEPATFT